MTVVKGSKPQSLIVVMLMSLGAIAWFSSAQAAELTAMEKLCAGYEGKKAMLDKRVKRGVHPWEKEKIKAQYEQLAADSAKHCAKPATETKSK